MAGSWATELLPAFAWGLLYDVQEHHVSQLPFRNILILFFFPHRNLCRYNSLQGDMHHS